MDQHITRTLKVAKEYQNKTILELLEAENTMKFIKREIE